MASPSFLGLLELSSSNLSPLSIFIYPPAGPCPKLLNTGFKWILDMKTFFLILATGLLGLSLPARATDEAAPPDPSAKAAVLIPGVVTRSQFTRDIKDLEPVDTVSTLTNDLTRIIYFTEIHDMPGQTVMHRWEYNGKIILEMPIKVGTSRWRGYSTKTLDPTWVGEWKVSVVDAAGGTLSVNTFSYLKQSKTPTSVATNPPP
jgi:hypothetical protein